MPVEGHVEIKGLDRALRRVPDALLKEMRIGFGRILRGFSRRFVRSNMSAGYRPRSSAARGVFVRSGALRRAMMSEVTGDSLDDLQGRVGWTDDKAARIAWVQEKGATIRPKRAQALTVPLEGARDPSGIPNTSAREVMESGNGFIAKGIIFENRGGEAVPMFALRKSVTIKGRLGFFKAWDSEDERATREKVLNEAVDRAIKRAARRSK